MGVGIAADFPIFINSPHFPTTSGLPASSLVSAPPVMITEKIVCVLTPPRSGSSLTAKVLSILGVYLGEDGDLAKPSEHNPKGYWEHESIIEINEAILSRMGFPFSGAGVEWRQQPAFPDAWEEDPRLNDLKERAIEVIERDFSHHRVWGWKDPRTCFTLPFWQSILPRMHYVICIRSPLDVASSQERFLDCSYERGLYLWLLYLRFALKYTSDQKRLLIPVESWMDGSQGMLRRLAGFLECAPSADNRVTREAVDKLIDRGLWHHRTSPQAVAMALTVHEQLSTDDEVGLGMDTMIGKILDTLAPEAVRGDADRVDSAERRWEEQFRRAANELGNLIPVGSKLILVDQDRLGKDVAKGRDVSPFLEQHGEYWGCPADSDAAIEEFTRLQRSGTQYIVFAWPAFWWLDYYSDFNAYLRLKFHCVLQNERVIVFDTRPSMIG